jgi:hypothetical protein
MESSQVHESAVWAIRGFCDKKFRVAPLKLMKPCHCRPFLSSHQTHIPSNSAFHAICNLNGSTIDYHGFLQTRIGPNSRSASVWAIQPHGQKDNGQDGRLDDNSDADLFLTKTPAEYDPPSSFGHHRATSCLCCRCFVSPLTPLGRTLGSNT